MAFEDILNTKASDIPPELPVPQGTYRVEIEPLSADNHINVDENFVSQAGREFIRIDIRVGFREALEDVDSAELEEYENAMGPISGASMWHSFFIDKSEENKTASLRRFMQNLGAFFDEGELADSSINELLEQIVGRNAVAVVQHRVYNDEIRANIARFAADR